jgi:hypothetical protein
VSTTKKNGETLVEANKDETGYNLLLNEESPPSSTLVEAPVDAHAQVMNVVLNVDEFAWRKSSSAAARAEEKARKKEAPGEVVTPDEEIVADSVNLRH